MAVSKVEVVVLGCLAEEPLYGYDLLERMRSRRMALWAEVGKASVYQALQRLEARGLIGGRAQEGREGPDRRVYRITRAGRSRLAEGLAERFGVPSPYETDAGLAMGFAHLLSPTQARRAIDARDRAVRDMLEGIGDARLGGPGGRGASTVVADAMLDRQEALARAELVWLRGFRASLSKNRR